MVRLWLKNQHEQAHRATVMVWTPPDGIDVPRWWC
jgi:hypothetical protein